MSSNATQEFVEVGIVGSSKLSIKEIILRAHEISEGKTYNFMLYNCRHFVMECLDALELIEPNPEDFLPKTVRAQSPTLQNGEQGSANG